MAVQLSKTTEREVAQLSTLTLLALSAAANGRVAPSPCRPLGAVPLGMGTTTVTATIGKPTTRDLPAIQRRAGPIPALRFRHACLICGGVGCGHAGDSWPQAFVELFRLHWAHPVNASL